MTHDAAGERIRVVAAVIRRDHTYLVCERPPEKRHGGLWEFPGGKCEAGETDAYATARELAEELGVHVLRVGEPLLTVAEPGSRYDIVFLPADIDGEPHAIEHSAIGWFDVPQLLTMPLAPCDRLFVESLRAPA